MYMLCIWDEIRMRWKCEGKYTLSEQLKMRYAQVNILEDLRPLYMSTYSQLLLP